MERVGRVRVQGPRVPRGALGAPLAAVRAVRPAVNRRPPRQGLPGLEERARRRAPRVPARGRRAGTVGVPDLS